MKRLAVYESILAIAAIGVLILAGAAWGDGITAGTATTAFQMACERHVCEICGAEFEVCESPNLYLLTDSVTSSSGKMVEYPSLVMCDKCRPKYAESYRTTMVKARSDWLKRAQAENADLRRENKRRLNQEKLDEAKRQIKELNKDVNHYLYELYWDGKEGE